MEVSSHSIDQHRVTGIEFDTTSCNYRKIILITIKQLAIILIQNKSFEMIKERKCIINFDNKYGKMIDKKINKETVKSSINLKVDFYYKSLTCDMDGINGIISHDNENIPISSDLVGEFITEHTNSCFGI